MAYMIKFVASELLGNDTMDNKFLKRGGRTMKKDREVWINILSHKLKKRLHNAPENQRIFPNTQPAIIEEQVFARVQELRENKRRPAKQAERQGLFSGLLLLFWHGTGE